MFWTTDSTFFKPCFGTADLAMIYEGEVFKSQIIYLSSIAIINTQFRGSWEKWDASCSYKTSKT